MRVANEFSKRTLCDIRHIRSASDPQRADPAQRYGVSHPNIVKAIGVMEKHPMEEKLTHSALAKLVHISPRHLGRLFRDQFDEGIMSLIIVIYVLKKRTGFWYRHRFQSLILLLRPVFQAKGILQLASASVMGCRLRFLEKTTGEFEFLAKIAVSQGKPC